LQEVEFGVDTHQQPLEKEELVRMLATRFEQSGYSVATSLETEEHRKPLPFDGQKPDVYASKLGGPLVLGVATLCENLYDVSTQEQWTTLSDAVNRSESNPGHELHIIVPSSCLEQAKGVAASLGIVAEFHTEL
jgi:hypothetical protein